MTENPVVSAALAWVRRQVGIVPVRDEAPGVIIPTIRWEADGPLVGEEAVRAHYAAHPNDQLAIYLDNSPWGGPKLGCIDDDSGKHPAGKTPLPRPLGGYAEATRSGGFHHLFSYDASLPPGYSQRVTGLRGFVDVLVAGILYVAPTMNAGKGGYSVITSLEAGVPAFPSVGLALEASADWLHAEWREAASGRAPRPSRDTPHGAFMAEPAACWGVAIRTVLENPGATDGQIRESVGCDHPEWSIDNIHRTAGRVRRWVEQHHRVGIDGEPAEPDQDWQEDTLLELARQYGIEPGALPKAAIHERIRAAQHLREPVTPGEPVDDELLPGVPAVPVRHRIAARIWELRTLFPAPAFMVRRDGNLAVDAMPCRAPLGVIPVALTDRNSPGSERWKLTQSLTGAAPFYSWMLPLEVYVAIIRLPEKVTPRSDVATAGAMIADTARRAMEEVVAPIQRRLSQRDGGHLIVFPAPEYIAVVLLTHEPASSVLGDLTARGPRAFHHDATIRPPKGPGDAERWLREVVDRVMSHHSHRGDWFGEVMGDREDEGVDQQERSLRRFHGMRPFGRALVERHRDEDPADVEERCPHAELLHPASPVVVRAEMDYCPYAPGAGAHLRMLVDHARDVPARLRRAGLLTPEQVWTNPVGPPAEAG